MRFLSFVPLAAIETIFLKRLIRGLLQYSIIAPEINFARRCHLVSLGVQHQKDFCSSFFPQQISHIVKQIILLYQIVIVKLAEKPFYGVGDKLLLLLNISNNDFRLLILKNNNKIGTKKEPKHQRFCGFYDSSTLSFCTTSNYRFKGLARFTNSASFLIFCLHIFFCNVHVNRL